LREDIEIDPHAAEKYLVGADPRCLHDLRDELATLDDWNIDAIRRAFEQVLTRHELKLGKLAQPVRVALTGGAASPGIFEVAEVLGKRRTLKRLEQALPIAQRGSRAP
jgi:glutamyl-tRNA synthetase